MRDRAFTVGVAVAMVAVVCFGLFVVGGPSAARKMAQDEERERRLRHVAHVLGCTSPLTDVPSALTETALQKFCSDRRVRGSVVDPQTRAPFKFNSSGAQFEVCATFHDADANDHFARLAPPRAEALQGEGVFCITGLLRAKLEPVIL